MSNAPNVSNTCDDNHYYNLGEEANFVVNFICTPIYFIVGLIGNILFLFKIVYTHSKTNPYLYQVFIAVGELLFVIAFAARIVIVEWTYPSYRPDVILPAWWWTCYSCVWYSAHFAIAIPSVISTYVEFLNIFMLVDRLRALRKGITYKPPTKYSYIGIVLLCFSASIAVNSEEFYSFRVGGTTSNGSLYTINYDYSDIPAAVYTTSVRSFVICAVLILSYALSAIIPFAYRQHLHKSKQVFTSAQELADQTRLRTLMAVAMCQAVTETVCQTLFVSRFLYAFLPAVCKNSRKQLYLAFCILGMQVSSGCNFYVMMLISKQFRRDVLKLFRKVNNSVGTTNTFVH